MCSYMCFHYYDCHYYHNFSLFCSFSACCFLLGTSSRWNLRLSESPHPLRTKIYKNTMGLSHSPSLFCWGNVIYMMLHVELVICHSISNRSGCFFCSGKRLNLTFGQSHVQVASSCRVSSHCRMQLRSYQSDFITKDWDLIIEQYMW